MIGFSDHPYKPRESFFFTKYDRNFIYVDTTEPGFYDAVLNFKSDDKSIRLFIKAVKLLITTFKVRPFYKPIMDLAYDWEKDKMFVSPSMPVPMELAARMWDKVLEHKAMPPYYATPWVLGDQYQYYAFLVYLINRMVKSGWKLEDALDAVVNNSKKIRKREPRMGMPTDYEEFLGLYNLTVTSKYLRNALFSGGLSHIKMYGKGETTNFENYSYITAGCDVNCSLPLADLRPSREYYVEGVAYLQGDTFAVPWVVLEV